MSWYIFLITFVLAILVTPLVKWFAIKIGATDKPNERKVHHKIMPRLGGLAIYIAFLIGFSISGVVNFDDNDRYHYMYILAGSLIIVVVGVLDDKYELSAKLKLLGQIIAAYVVVGLGGFYVDFINIPFEGGVDLGYLSIPISMLWIIAITNAINLIDGLDGLAAGVSTIALITISIIAISKGHIFVGVLALLLVASTMGFLVYNFYPAKIFMGDTGALFLGYMISVISLMDFKNITFFSLVVPILVLAVPIVDTFFAIIRRIVNKKPLSAPDKSHLHHCLLKLGFSHRQSVLVIYMISIIFSAAALILSTNIMWISVTVIIVALISIEIGVELTGMVNENYRPLLNMFNKLKLAYYKK